MYTIFIKIFFGTFTDHSMDRVNLNKSKKVLTKASKYIPKRSRICINWNPPFQIQIYSVKLPQNVNIVKQDLHNHNKNSFWKFYEMRSERGDFNWYKFWAFCYVLWCCGSRSQDFFTFIQIGSGHTVNGFLKKCFEGLVVQRILTFDTNQSFFNYFENIVYSFMNISRKKRN